MINFSKLKKAAPIFGYLSNLIDYPSKTTFSLKRYQQLKQGYPNTSQKKELLKMIKKLQQENLLEQQSHYTGLFEMNQRYTLYMTYYKLTDSRERGVVLAKLKMLYEMFGVSISGNELADYLPLILEFLSIADFEADPRKQDLQLAIQVVENGTYELLKNAVIEIEDPYFQLIQIIRNELKSCIGMEAKVR
ncbi:nitrate reductase molybdenum cofactor assembly chaperone [Liquorilactobacillus satsumensis]|uniref:nitrate reductase molybdenum cofactor assembly chaperone n=1 Tax=Liquorilactobacillus satsumensis TaxID=259059 RepID=UPI0039EBFC16